MPPQHKFADIISVQQDVPVNYSNI